MFGRSRHGAPDRKTHWLVYEHRRRNRAEILARSSLAELTHMNRLAAASELSASIAHEVNQPITGIVAMANAALRWLSGEVPNNQKVHDLLVNIVSAGHRASEVVTGVRAMFKKSTDVRLPVDINRLILRVLEIVRIDSEKSRVHVQTDLADPLPNVPGDDVQLQQVILNLVMNAIEAMQSVELRILRIQTRRSGPDMVRASIEDTGVGIDPSKTERIFERLFTTKSHGMGMGLSICQSIIENHGGTISVAAGAEKGTIFCFELPAAAQTASPAELAA